jgi:hypothetical protein
VNRRDSGVAFALVAVLGILAGAIAIPAFRPAAVPAPIPTAAPSLGHVQGVLGRPWSITPRAAIACNRSTSRRVTIRFFACVSMNRSPAK